MKRFLTMAIVAGLALGGSSMAFAAFCSLDQVPAATILYPFVVYDYNNSVDGETTYFSVTNVSAEPQVVHFTLWTDYSMHVLDWNVILSGYDVQSTNIRDILELGILPSTGTTPLKAKAPNPEGPISTFVSPYEGLPKQEDRDSADFFMEARCPDDGSYYPVYGTIPLAIRDRIEDFLTASQTADTGIAACDTEDGGDFDVSDEFESFWFIDRNLLDPTWMYITADVVWTCNGMFPDSDESYWTQAPQYEAPASVDGPQAMYDNVLIADIFYLNPSARFSEAIPAVHLESLNPYDGWGNDHFFYGQYIQADSGPFIGDFREPLGTIYGFRWLNNAIMGSKVRVFKRASHNNDYPWLSPGIVHDLWLPDFNSENPTDPPEEMYALDCIPYTYYAWDENENPTSAQGGTTGPSCPPNTPECTTFRINILPLETQEVDITQFNLPEVSTGVTAQAGWMMLIFPLSNSEYSPVLDYWQDCYQVYVSVRYDAHGNFSAAMPAALLGNYNCDSSDMLPWAHVGRFTMTESSFAE